MVCLRDLCDTKKVVCVCVCGCVSVVLLLILPRTASYVHDIVAGDWEGKLKVSHVVPSPRFLARTLL